MIKNIKTNHVNIINFLKHKCIIYNINNMINKYVVKIINNNIVNIVVKLMIVILYKHKSFLIMIQFNNKMLNKNKEIMNQLNSFKKDLVKY